MNTVIQPEFRIVPRLDQDEILEWLRVLRLRAYAPGSGYKLAAVLAMKHGPDYVLAAGVNVECLDHRHGTHGESSAISALATAFGKQSWIDAVWTMGAPKQLTTPCNDPLAAMYGFTCGDCRQHIDELARTREIELNGVSLNGAVDTKRLKDLLPDSFTFGNIDTALLESKKASALEAESIDHNALKTRVMRSGTQSESDIFEWLNTLESIDYASHVHQAVILHLSNGAYVAGVKVENAAYVGLSAMQSALAIAITAFGKIDVRGIYTLSRPENGAMDMVYPLPLSSLQSLSEFATDHTVLVTLFTPNGDSATMTLGESTGLFTSFAAPAYALDRGRLKTA